MEAYPSPLDNQSIRSSSNGVAQRLNWGKLANPRIVVSGRTHPASAPALINERESERANVRFALAVHFLALNSRVQCQQFPIAFFDALREASRIIVTVRATVSISLSFFKKSSFWAIMRRAKLHMNSFRFRSTAR